MNDHYCGWDKNLGDDATAANDFAFLPLQVKEEINSCANQGDLTNNTTKQESVKSD